MKNEVESLAKAKSQAVSVSKELEGKLIEMNGKVDDAIRQLSEATSTKARLLEENLSLTRRVETLEFEYTSIQSTYKRVQGDYEEARLHLESEMAVGELMGRIREREKENYFRPIEHFNRPLKHFKWI